MDKLPILKMIGLISLYEEWRATNRMQGEYNLGGLWQIISLSRLDTQSPRAELQRIATWDGSSPIGEKVKLPYNFVNEYFERKQIVRKEPPKWKST